MDSDEDLKDYKAAHEPPSHWNLRKKFIQKYRDKLDDDELRCLSQVLLNIEFLGCVYPLETMQRIHAMAGDVLKEFRESQRGSFKRTLVSAQQTTANKYRKTMDDTNLSKRVKTDLNINFVRETVEVPDTVPEPDEVEEVMEVIDDANWSAEHRKFKNLLKDVVLFKMKEEAIEVNFNNSIRKTIDQNQQQKWKETLEKSTYTCSYCNQMLVKVDSTNVKKARVEGFQKLYKLLKNYCYTLEKKVNFYSGDIGMVEKPNQPGVVVQKPEAKQTETFDEHKLGSDNIGFRMLKALGWKEGNNKGIVDPIGLSVKIGRGGLGHESKNGKKLNLNHFRSLMTNYKNSGTNFDLVFSSEFTKDEREQLHKLAQKLGLKSKSEGKDQERFLTVRRKTNLTAQELLKKVLDKDPFYSAIYKLEPPELKLYEELEL